jgi:hypothetical protein
MQQDDKAAGAGSTLIICAVPMNSEPSISGLLIPALSGLGGVVLGAFLTAAVRKPNAAALVSDNKLMSSTRRF